MLFRVKMRRSKNCCVKFEAWAFLSVPFYYNSINK